MRTARKSASTHYISGTERMTIMLDALLAAIPDGAYFNQTDFGTKLKDQLLVSDIPFSCYLKGAALWGFEKHTV
jgi:predicted metal-dependent hydrolase